MKKSLLLSSILIIFTIIFCIGVISGLNPNTNVYNNLNTNNFSSSNNYVIKKEKIPDIFSPLNITYDNLSGDKTTINGIPIKMWIATPKNNISSDLNKLKDTWNKKSLFMTESETKHHHFLQAIDYKNKKFIDIIASKSSLKHKIIMPFSIDLEKSSYKENFDSDIPKELQKKNVIHIKTCDNKKFMEKFYIKSDFNVSKTSNMIKTYFLNKNWKVSNKDHNNNSLSLEKESKLCIIYISKSQNELGSSAFITVSYLD